MIAPAQIDGSFQARQHPAVAGVELDGEAVLYHEEANTVHVLNPTATIVWNCLDGSTLDGLCADLAEAFSIDVGTIREDVLPTVQEFGRQGLIEGVEPDAVTVNARLLPLAGATEPSDDG